MIPSIPGKLYLVGCSYVTLLSYFIFMNPPAMWRFVPFSWRVFVPDAKFVMGIV